MDDDKLLGSCPTSADLARAMLDDPDQPNGPLEREILEGIVAGKARSGRADAYSMEHATRGERLADRVAAVGGSWGFIIAFGVVLFGWMIINSAIPHQLGLRFDPYPFIFLNLLLSMLAAIQAPIIMMSQNRQATKDRPPRASISKPIYAPNSISNDCTTRSTRSSPSGSTRSASKSTSCVTSRKVEPSPRPV